MVINILMPVVRHLGLLHFGNLDLFVMPCLNLLVLENNFLFSYMKKHGGGKDLQNLN